MCWARRSHTEMYKEKLLAMRIEIIKLKAENQKLESELDTLRRQQKGVSDVK